MAGPAQVKPPLPLGAMSLMGASMPAYEEDPRVNTILDTLTDSLGSKDQNWKDEQLAFAGGAQDPRGNGSFGGAMSGGFKAQSEQRAKTKELQAQYLPQILNTVISQQSARQSNAMLQNMMGPQGGGWIQTVSEKYGIAPEAIQSDLLTNGGKGIREMIFKNSTPTYDNKDGALIDTNPYTNGMYAESRGQGGGGMPTARWTPGLTTAANGQTTARMPNPNARGGISIFAPEGAMPTNKAYLTQSAETTADWDPQTVTPRGENPQQTTRGNLVRQLSGSAPTGQQGAGPQLHGGAQPPRAAVRGNFEGSPQQIAADISSIRDPAAREQAMQAYENQMRGTNPAFQSEVVNGAEVPGNAMPAAQGNLQRQLRQAQADRDPVRVAQIRQKMAQATGNPPSVGMELESPAEGERNKAAVVEEAKQLGGNLGEMKKAQNAVSMYDKAIKALEEDKATSSGLGAVRDKGFNFFGKATEASVAAEELRTLGKWLTSNVPRMEGPQSNFDVANYEQMTGMVANENLPTRARLAAAKAAKQLIMDAAPKEFGAGWQPQVNNAPAGGMPAMSAIQAEIARRKGGK